MIYARQPSDEEDQELRLMIRRETGRVSQRARMILLSTQRRCTADLAEIFATDKVTVRRWIHRFNVQGPAGLYDVPRPGRPRKNARPEQDVALSPPAPNVVTWPHMVGSRPDSSIYGRTPERATPNYDEPSKAAGFKARLARRQRATRAGMPEKRRRSC
jgi:hypothetical protein